MKHDWYWHRMSVYLWIKHRCGVDEGAMLPWPLRCLRACMFPLQEIAWRCHPVQYDLHRQIYRIEGGEFTAEFVREILKIRRFEEDPLTSAEAAYHWLK